MLIEWLPLLPGAALRASVVLGAAWALTSLLGRASASTRHFVWTCAIAGAVLVPAAMAVAPRWTVALPPALAPVASVAATPSRGDASSLPAPPVSPDAGAGAMTASSFSGTPGSAALDVATLAWLAPGVWALGAMIVLAYALLGAAATWWIRRSAAPVRAGWVEQARVLAEALEVPGSVAFVESAQVMTPMVCGLWRPFIVMPRSATDWSDERLRVVVLHELAHIKRRDCVTQAMARAVCAIYWFNPLAWVAASRLRAERERACDDFVLSAGAKGSDYASHLLEIARAMRPRRLSPLAGAGLAMAHRSQLEGRLVAILDPETRRSSALVTKLASVALVLAISAPVAAIRLQRGLEPAAGESVTSSDERPTAPDDAPAAALAGSSSPLRSASPSPSPSPAPIAAALQDAISSGVIDGVRQSVQRRLGALAGMSMADAAAQAPQADAQTMEALTAALRDADADVREAVVHALSRMSDPRVIDALLPLLADSDADVREQVVHVLGRTREPRVVAALAAVVNDSSAGVREQVVHMLGQARNPESIPTLVRALDDSSADVREQAAYALGQFRDAGAVAPLTKALADSSPDVREQAAYALGQIGDRRAAGALVAALKDENADVREQSAFALGALRDPTALPALAAALRDPSADVREQAAYAIGRMSQE